MGASFSSCDEPSKAPQNPAFAGIAPAGTSEKESTSVDYSNLPQPIKYEEMQREAFMALKWESFEGLKFDITKPLNQNFFLSHRMAMTGMEVGQPGQPVLKTPHTEYNFGATVANEKFLLMGQMGGEGVLTSRITWKPSDMFGIKMEARTTGEKDGSQVMGDLEGAGKDWNGQLKMGTGGFYGLNYMQSITPKLSAGGEFFYLQPQGRSGVGLATRYASDKCVATMQLATTGIVSLTYYHKVSQKAHVATDFLWNLRAQEATSSLGYDYHLRQCRIRGSIDSNGKIAAYLEERMGPGVQLILSAEINHWRNDHKFGFGMTVGES